jgi:hypothetical protein
MIQVVYPGSESRFPDPRVKKAPDPGSGSATLDKTPFFETAALMYLYRYVPVAVGIFLLR